jgi:hypothetical protein
MSAGLPPRVERRVRRVVEEILLSEAASLGRSRAALDELGRQIGQLEARSNDLRAALDQGLSLVRFTAGTTVDRAAGRARLGPLRRLPGAPRRDPGRAGARP